MFSVAYAQCVHFATYCNLRVYRSAKLKEELPGTCFLDKTLFSWLIAKPIKLCMSVPNLQ